MTKRKQKSCHQCRTRHLKCDGRQPCMHCERGTRECNRDSNHIFLSESNIGIVRRGRKYSLSFENDQKWINLPSSVRFADATASSTGEAASSGETTPARSNCSIDGQRSCSPTQVSYQCDGFQASGLSDPALDPSTDILQQPFQDFFVSSHESLSADREARDVLLQASLLGLSDQSRVVSEQGRCTKSEVLWPHKAQWPFTIYQEAYLMRHFVREIAPWWDIIDGASHFTSTIPELAATSPALLHAIFALSSKHLSLMGKMDEAVSLRYTDVAYQALLPDLQAKAYEGENLAAVLLLCQVLSLNPDQPAESYGIKLGFDIFLSAWKANPTSSLHGQIFFSVLRMDFHQSFYSGKTLEEIENDCEWMWPSLHDASGSSRQWSCHLQLHAARCLNFVSNRAGRTWERWMSLKRFSDTWRVSKPGYFDPVFQKDSLDDDPFPTRMFASALFAGTHQFFSLARLLLLNNQPETPLPSEYDILPLSPKEIEVESRLILRRVIGTVICHVDSAAVLLASTMAITYCGHLLTDASAQESAFKILELAQKHAPGVIPSQEFVRLRRVWGWDEEVIYQNVL